MKLAPERKLHGKVRSTEGKILPLSTSVEEIKDKFRKSERRQHKTRVRDEILQMMEGKRKRKESIKANTDIHRTIPRKIRETKQKEMEGKRHEIEIFNNIYTTLAISQNNGSFWHFNCYLRNKRRRNAENADPSA